jgi:hypothetical protein
MNWFTILETLPGVLQAVLQALATVEQATGKTSPEAAKEVIDHLTPGAPNSDVLKPS